MKVSYLSLSPSLNLFVWLFYLYVYCLLCPCVLPGIYLPLLWEASFCWKTPVALAYTRGHFSALISIASDDTITSSPTWSNRKAHDCHVTYLPLVDSEGKSLPLHFLSEQEVGCQTLKSFTARCQLSQTVQDSPGIVVHIPGPTQVAALSRIFCQLFV